jgi:hypothetical protein
MIIIQGIVKMEMAGKWHAALQAVAGLNGGLPD